ncbi:hypothetical protein D3C72_1036520 [compost metagenome]
MRVMRHVEDHRGPSRQHLEASRQLDECQPVAHFLRAHRQLRAHGLQRGQHGGGVEQLVGAAQRRVAQAIELAPAAAPVPLLAFLALGRVKVEIAAHQPQL